MDIEFSMEDIRRLHATVSSLLKTVPSTQDLQNNTDKKTAMWLGHASGVIREMDPIKAMKFDHAIGRLGSNTERMTGQAHREITSILNEAEYYLSSRTKSKANTAMSQSVPREAVDHNKARETTENSESEKIFIGHGRSKEWLALKDFLSQELNLQCDEFNLEPAAGLQTSERIETMLKTAKIAFLVMTAEDKHKDETLHARENVIHEIGLFQAKLGSKRAIVLREEGCTKPTNLAGLTTIDFPSNDIMSCSEKIRGVLTREKILTTK